MNTETKSQRTRQIAILGVLTALVIVMSTTPLGSLPVGPLVITLNMIPVALAAIVAGPIGGLAVGAIFGLFSFAQACGMFIPSGMGALTMSISPVFTFIQRVVSRALAGFLLGYVFSAFKKLINRTTAFFITGCFASLLNFVFFMGSLWALFGSYTKELSGVLNGKAWAAYIGATFLSNTIFEIIATTILVGAIATGLAQAKLLNNNK